MAKEIEKFLDYMQSLFPDVYVRKASKKLPTSKQIGMPQELISMFELVDGEEKLGGTHLPIPTVCKWLRLLSFDASIELRSNMLGLNYLFNSKNRPKISTDLKLKSAMWDEKWWPIAQSAHSVDDSILFLDQSSGYLILQEWKLEDNSKIIVRLQVSQSISSFFLSLTDKISREGIDWCLRVSDLTRENSKNTKLPRINTSSSSKENFLDDWKTALINYYRLIKVEVNAGVSVSNLSLHIPKELLDSYKITSGWFWPLVGYDQINVLKPDELCSYNKFDQEEGKIETLSAEVKPYYSSQSRLTFAESDYCRFQIDFDPESTGKAGQIVVFDNDAETIKLFCSSIIEFFRIATASMDEFVYNNPDVVAIQK